MKRRPVTVNLARFDLDGPKLARKRESMRMERDDLATALGVSTATIYAWEAGRYTIPPYVGLAIKWLAEMSGEARLVRKYATV